MLFLIIVQFLLTLWVICIFRSKIYEDADFTEKPVLPIWYYLLLIGISLIPVIGIILFMLEIWFIFWISTKGGGYYKPGWFIKLLTKEI